MMTDLRKGPSAAMIRLGEALFLAKAWLEVVGPVVEACEAEILAAHAWYMGEDMQAAMDPSNPGPVRITKPKNAWTMPEAQFGFYAKMVAKAVSARGFNPKKPGNCPKLEAEAMVRDAENALLEQLGKDVNPTLGRLNEGPFELRDRAIALTESMIAPHIDADRIMGRLKATA